MKTSKRLLTILLLLNQVVITSPKRITQQDLAKTITAFQQLEIPYPYCSTERITLFDAETIRCQHRRIHNNSDLGYYSIDEQEKPILVPALQTTSLEDTTNEPAQTLAPQKKA